MPWGAAAVVGSAIIGGIASNRAADKAADASTEAAQIQADSAQAALDQQIELNQPYLDIGTSSIPGYESILGDPRYNTFETLQNDPYGYDYLSNNPLFGAAVDYSGDQLQNAAAAQGRHSSGGLVDQLFQNYLATGDRYWNNFLSNSDSLANTAYNRALMPVQMGQNAANFQGVNSANLLTGAGSALAAGQVGAANANSQNVANLIDIGGQVVGYGTNSGWFNGSTPNYRGAESDLDAFMSFEEGNLF